MFAVCLRYAQNKEQAEDILQMGFFKVFSKGESYQGGGSLEGWIKRVLINTALELFRKNKMDFIDEPTAELQNINSPYEADHSIYYKDLLSIVETLPLGYRTVFNLYAIEGYAHKEIAAMLNISEGSSKSQLSRARQWLQERIMYYEKAKR